MVTAGIAERLISLEAPVFIQKLRTTGTSFRPSAKADSSIRQQPGSFESGTYQRIAKVNGTSTLLVRLSWTGNAHSM